MSADIRRLLKAAEDVGFDLKRVSFVDSQTLFTGCISAIG
jgi:hypothetical protein